MASRPRTGDGSSSGLSPGESAAAIGLGVLVVVSGAVWAAGEAAALLASGQPLQSGFGAAPGTLLRLTRHGSDPALAWPAADRMLLPGPVGFYAVALVMLLLLFGGLILALRVKARFGFAGGRERDARFARPRDLRRLRVRHAQPGRVTLGRAGAGLLAAEARQSVLVVGPTQTGKTTGLAIPAILEWAGPVIATSIKTDLLRDTITSRAARGRAFVFDPTGCTGLERASWTPLAASSTWAGAQRMATGLVDAARPARAGIEDPEFWLRLARKLLAPLLLAASLGELTIADVVRWVDTQDESEPRWILDDAGEAAALQAFEASINRDPKTKGGAYATTETILEAYADPNVLASAMTSDITPDALLDGSASTLYLCAPAHEQRRLQPIFAALIGELLNAAAECASATGKPLDPPLLVVLDECANIAPLSSLDALASSGAGQGIQLVTVFQDVAQITTAYGSERARTILANHRAMLLLAGITDPETLEHVSRIIGDEPSHEISATRGSRGERSTTESTRYLSLMPPNALRQMRPGDALLIYGHLPPARLKLRPWFRERSLRSLGAPKAP